MTDLGPGDTVIVLGDRIGKLTVEYVDAGGVRAITTTETGEEYVLPLAVLQKVDPE